MKTIMILAATSLLFFPVYGKSQDNMKQKGTSHNHKMDHQNHNHKDGKAEAKKVSPEKIIIKVKGMVCAFCAQGIQKNFSKRKEVKDVKVDLDTMEVTILLVKGQILPEKVIESVVTGAGFKYMGLK